MLKVGLVGIGFMGRGHLDQYLRLAGEGFGIELVALCDVDAKKFEGIFVGGNMGDLGQSKYDFSKYHLYTNFDEMIAKEELDYVDIALPTFLHCHYTVKALNAKINVLCEKPMAINPEQCRMMTDAAKATGKQLMIAQCLRFWPAYEVLKEYIDGEKLGKPVFLSFYRGGGTPMWSYENWLLDEVRAGGCLLDQHVHDVDMINWLFGEPEAVSSLGRNVFPGAGFDAVTTHYRYDGFIVNAQDDWSMNGDVPFKMTYRASFERGTIIFEDGKAIIYPTEGGKIEADNKNREDGYYREIKYFANAIINGEPIETATPESTGATIRIATAERESARRNGEWVSLS